MALIGATNEEKIWNFLRKQGYGEYGAAGVMGNLGAESGLSPINLQNNGNKKLELTDEQFTAKVDDGSYSKDTFVHDGFGYGIAQHTYWSRKQNLYEYVKGKGKSIGDLEAQLEFFVKELAGYKGSDAEVKKATSVKQASDFMVLNYERPASVGPNATQAQRDATCAKRAAMGQEFYDKFADKKPVVSGGGGSSRMKYSDNNKPLQCIMTQSTCYKGTSKMNVLGVLWHSTGANNPNVKRYVQPDDNAANRAELIGIIGQNANRNDWNHATKQAGVNAFVGKLADGTVAAVQTLPWDYRPWGCGSGKKGSCNNSHIQFEIAEDSLNDPTYFNAVYKEACELTAYLCKMYNIDPHGTVTVGGVKVPTILCHADSYKLGLGSNHSDVYHWFNKYGKTMDTVRDDVAALLKGSGASTVTPPQTSTPTPTPAPAPVETPKPTDGGTFSVGEIVNFVGNTHYSNANAAKGSSCNPGPAKVSSIYKNGKHPYHLIREAGGGATVYGWVDAKDIVKAGAAAKEFEPYKVKVTNANLNIRKGAGTNYAVCGAIRDKGVYTIVKEADGAGASKWGYLKSGAGWISLDYCKKL